jgi:hypothetical protein
VGTGYDQQDCKELCFSGGEEEHAAQGKAMMNWKIVCRPKNLWGSGCQILRDPDMRYVYDALGYNGLTPNVPGLAQSSPATMMTWLFPGLLPRSLVESGKLPLSDTTTGVIVAHRTIAKEMRDDNRIRSY